MEPIIVTCAVILSDNKVFAAQRSLKKSQGGLWEFPGGKLEKGESTDACLIREIREELAIDIQLLWRLNASEYSYENGNLIRLIPFVCKQIAGELRLFEHEAIKFLSKEELFSVNWAPADIPIVKDLQRDWNLIQKKLLI